MSSIKENESLYDYYIRIKSEQMEWKNQIKNEIIKKMQNDEKKYVYATILEGRDYVYNADKSAHELTNKSLLDVAKYVESEGLKWYLDIILRSNGLVTRYDPCGSFIIYW